MTRWSGRLLAAVVLGLVLLAGCVPAPTTLPQRTGETAPPDVAAIENEVASRVNDYRRRQGLGALASDGILSDLAREHSRRMAEGRRDFGHDGFEQRGERVHEELGAMTVSENVAYNNYPADRAAERVVTAWIASPGHRQNLVGAFNRMGTGAARTRAGVWYVTQLYAAVPNTGR